MRTLLLVATAALALGACSYPDTKMVPVEPTQSQMQSNDPAAPAADGTTSEKPASGKSAAATR